MSDYPPFTARANMEADGTAMVSGSTSAFEFHCIACGVFRYLTPRVWVCDVCEDYNFLCESCYERSLEDCEAISAPPQVHNPDHPMTPHVATFGCDGCESAPIWNRRWRCMVCFDIDLCEACYRELEAADMPPGHSKEHPMIAFEVLCPEYLLNFQSSFSKPADPQWSYRVDVDSSRCGFKWVKRKPLAEIFSSSQMSAMDDSKIIQVSHKTGHTSRVEKQMSLKRRHLAISEPSETTRTKRIFDERCKIFLSHAGAEKDFVEQLYVDLSRVHHFGIFFDKDDASLPKGESFPERIFDVAKHCELAIVVISADYFIRKWPMLELATFVKAQKARPELKILPVFYKLSVEEFKQPKCQQLYVRSWMQMPGITKDDVQLWNEALKVISRTNGIDYDKKMGEVAFREKIVEIIYKRVKPALLWDDSHVQGKARMHKIIELRIQSSNNMAKDMSAKVQSRCTPCVGLYGMGGSGKTTLCKVFRNEMMQGYLGKVYHIEFGSMDTLELRKKLLLSMSLCDSSLLMTIDDGQALTLLKHSLPRYKICLIIDNVVDNSTSIEEARILLDLPFEEGSLTLVTSRSRVTLEKLKIKKTSLMRIPTLTSYEAKALFCHHAGCNSSTLSEDAKKAMESYVERCNFQVEDMVSQEYHPLALKVLGTRVGPNPKEWENIIIDFKHYENENKHHIFSILRSSYDNLSHQHQKMFLDIALNKRNYSKCTSDTHMRWQMRCLYNEGDERFISDMVKILQAESLVEFYNVEDGIYIHDLYREFALMEIKKKGLHHSPSCCLSWGSSGQHFVQEGRLRIQNQLISHVTSSILSCKTCSDAQLLTIESCSNLKSVDVSGMWNLKMFQVSGGCPQLTSVNLEGAINLQSLAWHGFLGGYPDLRSLESLEGLWLVSAENYLIAPPLKGSLDFSRSSKLEVLCLSYLPLNLLNLNQVVNLRNFYVYNCQYLEKFEGLEALVKLEDLRVFVCSSLLEFPSLANFPSLRIFQLEGATRLKEIQGFANLIALQTLSIKGGHKLKELPGIEDCTKMGFLDLSDTNIQDFSWISVMKDLMCINLSGTKLRFVPEFSKLNKLSELWLDNCETLESLGDNMGIHPTLPQTLEVISAENCWRLKSIPHFNSESALYQLNIRGTSVEEIPGIMYCKYLVALCCAETHIRSLPDLTSLTRLKSLDVRRCELLTRMDNTKSLPALEELCADDCTRLLALPNLGSSKGLTSLSMINCPLLDPNSVKLLSAEWTVDMEMENAADEQLNSGVEGHECEEQTLAMDCHEPVPAHALWRFASFLTFVVASSTLVWTLRRKAGKCRLGSQDEDERR